LLRCAPLVPVVKTANLGFGNDGSESQRVHGPWFRRVLGQREVRPGFVIVRHERLQMEDPQDWREGEIYHIASARDDLKRRVERVRIGRQPDFEPRDLGFQAPPGSGTVRGPEPKHDQLGDNTQQCRIEDTSGRPGTASLAGWTSSSFAPCGLRGRLNEQRNSRDPASSALQQITHFTPVFPERALAYNRSFQNGQARSQDLGDVP
jgi:hypothetical protein